MKFAFYQKKLKLHTKFVCAACSRKFWAASNSFLSAKNHLNLVSDQHFIFNVALPNSH